MSFDLQTNNCWDEVKRQYFEYWGCECPVKVNGERPDKVLQVHRFALRLVRHFGIAHQPQDGCIVMMSVANVIHHYGFYKAGMIHTFSEHGYKVLSESELSQQGIGGHRFSKIKYLNTRVV